MKVRSLLSVFMGLLVLLKVQAYEANAHRMIHADPVTGKVVMEDGEALPGVNILVKGTGRGTTTDADGNYSIMANEGETLVFSFIGYATQEIAVGARSVINVQLLPDAQSLNEIVVVGYGEQKKETVTGAISSVDGKQLVQTPVANISNSLVGRVPGLMAIQQSGEPGYDQSRIKIRGIATLYQGAESDPLVLVDGVPREFNQIDPNEIESINILKDASATAVFGVRGANGVILIKTRSGKSGKTQMSYTANVGFQSPTQLPDLLNSYEYATLYNEARVNGGGAPYFSPADLELYRNGSDPIFHPDVDWFDKVMRSHAAQQQHNFNISGGTDHTRYFVSLGYFDQQGLYDVNKIQKDFSANPRYKRYNIRSNIDLDFNDNFSGSVKLGGQIADMNYPGLGAGDIFFRILSSNPLMNPGVVDGKVISTVEGLPSSTGNPLQFIISNGYQNNVNSNLNTNISLEHKLDFITTGLKVRGMIAYDHFYSHWTKRNKATVLYSIIKDPDDPTKPVYIRQGSDAPFTFAEGYARNRKLYTEVALEYTRSFSAHTFSALALYMQEKKFDPGYAYHVPMAYRGTVGRITYNYAERYLAEFNMGYNGSENFPESKRFGFFPAFSLGWAVTEESFFPQNNVLTRLKIRGSYGEVGNDKISDERFLYLPSVFNYGGGYHFGEVGDNYQWYGGSQEGKIGNPDVTWERAKKINIGIETLFFSDKLGFTVDIFRERRDNILAYLGTVPDLVQANLPPVNLGKVENKGIELDLTFNSNVGMFNYWVKGNYTFARNEIIFKDEPIRAHPWLQETGQAVGQYFGLVNEGFYNTQADLDAGPTSSFGPLQLGDIRYKDVDGNGVIDDNDRMPIGYATFPQVVYGASFGFNFKNFDFSILFQGAEKVSTQLGEMAAWAFDTEWRSAQKQHLNRWTQERYEAGETITYPRVELSPTSGKHNYRPSDFWLLDASYIRLKNAEVAYTFKGAFLGKAGIRQVRIFANGSNLVTWSKMKNYDPEAPQGRGQFYPQVRVYNFGVNVQF
jgi:TonB-linked SusC/RagA family outer membrane protein